MNWAATPLDRHQAALFSPTLDQSISPDHSVRLFDETLGSIDFSDWEACYARKLGQPPIHPLILAACILYGQSLGIRSSRRLEDAARNRLDFIWLMKGHQPDHATICDFRLRFCDQLKGLFRKVGRVAISMGMVSLNQITLDGTTIRADSSRHGTLRRSGLEKRLAALDEQIEAMMAQSAEQDRVEDALYGVETSPVRLPRDLRDLKNRQETLGRAMKALEQIEAERSARGERRDVSQRGPAVPVADPDSRVLPSKQGGYAPNYTAVVAVDSAAGIIVDTQALGNNDEAGSVLAAVANVVESFGRTPGQLAADSGFNSGPNLAELDRQGIEALMPAKQELGRDNPAVREDASQPVAREHWPALAVNPQNKILDKSAFVYEAGKDQYLCPMGRVLSRVEDKAYNRRGVKGTYRMYQCGSCAGCPLASRCLPKESKARRVSRDEHEPLREKMKARMAGESGRRQYNRRAWSSETPFAVFKTAMNFGRFLLRGIEKVTQELRWEATAYNLMKIVRFRMAGS